MEQSCTGCGAPFEILSRELELLERISPTLNGERFSIPPPKHCPPCREQRRMSWRNERNLFSRVSDKTGKKLVSMFPPDNGFPKSGFPVWANDEWWSDQNDATAFGRPVDFKKPIFEQMAALRTQVPRMHTFNYADDRQVNSTFTNCAGDIKDCYLIFGCLRDELCMYSTYINDCYSCLDCLFTFHSTNCYQCTDCRTCNSCFFSSECSECSDSFFLFDCRGCTDCIGCFGLRQKRFQIFNEQFTQADYLKKRRELGFEPGQVLKSAALQSVTEKFKKLLLTAPHRPFHGEQNENSVGDYLWNTKDCYACFDTSKGRDLLYCTWYNEGKDSMDIYAWGETELCYQISGGGEQMYQCAFTAKSFGCKESYYLDQCVYCKNCFACVGVKNQQYCILNQRYTKQEYEKLLPEVLRLMQQTGEWGRYFPEKDSPWGYNYSIASDYYPLSRADALKNGFRWDDYVAPQPAPERIFSEQDLLDVSADERLLSGAARCALSGKYFRYTKLELEFYRKNYLSPPLLHPDIRHRARLHARNPRRLWKRFCEQCGTQLLTTHDPAKPTVVYCEKCYLSAVYD